jgi:hypothetical protein
MVRSVPSREALVTALEMMVPSMRVVAVDFAAKALANHFGVTVTSIQQHYRGFLMAQLPRYLHQAVGSTSPRSDIRSSTDDAEEIASLSASEHDVDTEEEEEEEEWVDSCSVDTESRFQGVTHSCQSSHRVRVIASHRSERSESAPQAKRARAVSPSGPTVSTRGLDRLREMAKAMGLLGYVPRLHESYISAK